MKSPLFLAILVATLVRNSLEIEHRTLYVHEDDNRQNKLRLSSDATKSSSFSNEPKLTKVFHLNDDHQELTVQWAGEGTGVIICLATDPPSNQSPPGSSAVYISYNYGDTFKNETDKFQPLNGTNLSLDKFYNHQQFASWTVFTDTTNRVLYSTLIEDGGIIVTKYKISFMPSELIFSEKDPKIFMILDEEDGSNKLWLTHDYGASFSEVMQAVTAVYWSSPWAEPPLLYVQRREASGLYSVLAVTSLFKEGSETSTVIEGILDFEVKGDFAFATKNLKDKGIALLVSYQGSPFEEAHFDRITSKHIGYYIADVSGSDIFVAAIHDNELPTLYFSHGNNGKVFSLSLRNFACYFPGQSWNESSFKSATNTAFADFYKVDGLHGIYIASQFQIMKLDNPTLKNFNIENLSTLITFNNGKRWQLLNEPTSEANGTGESCSKDNRCSLHLVQKFGGLFLGSKIMPPVTSQFAPGVIIATGTSRASQNGEYGIFISTDAGITWWQALTGQHMYQMGDYGGAIVAIRYNEESGTKEILYSTDSGHNWHSQPFFVRDIQVSNILAEYGGKSTVFTMFGTENYGNDWLVIKADLRKAFSKNCSKDDYEFWSPSTEYTGSTSCVMGEKEIHERRKPESSCYIDQDYIRSTKKELCDCSPEDFECDVGYLKHKFSLDCVRDKNMESPYGVPDTCMPGEFYNRTKGYRIVPEDVCKRGSAGRYLPDTIPCPDRKVPELILVAGRNGIYQHDIVTNSWEILSQRNLTNTAAIEVDVHNSCIYWADLTAHTIERQCMNGVNISHNILLSNVAPAAEGLALDWVSRLLYFTLPQPASIRAIHIDKNAGDNMRTNTTILSSPVLERPRGIAVHPREGLLFWTDWGNNNPSVSRANADGSDVRQLFVNPDVVWPNGLAIDFIGERIYWVDARLDYMASADLDGLAFRKIITDSEYVTHPFAIAVFKDIVYWSDWNKRMIFQADKDNGGNIHPLSEKFQLYKGIKIFAYSLQEGTNVCAGDVNQTICSHMCIGLPRQNYTCKCPDKFQLAANNTCMHSCGGEEFKCENTSDCIDSSKRCNGFKDCPDNSDELDCPPKQCDTDAFKCETVNQCIPTIWRCDGDFDCSDHSDEQKCAASSTTPAAASRVSCSSPFFLCNDGRACIPPYWKCDGAKDCFDGSDEEGCTNTSTVNSQGCSGGGKEFKCESTSDCIASSKRCDGFKDCPDNSDELDCQPKQCDAGQFKCKTINQCIPTRWWCDGDFDCSDHSDEQKCAALTTTLAATTSVPCSSPFFLCKDGGACIPPYWKCDGAKDCFDGSDEEGCTNTSTVNSQGCSDGEFRCETDSKCIPNSKHCDGYMDCSDNSDERDCPTKHCATTEVKCVTRNQCIPASSWCDGEFDCSDHSDEQKCAPPTTTPAASTSISCSNGFFPCNDGERCIPHWKRCNRFEDCDDGSDEKGCTYMSTKKSRRALFRCSTGKYLHRRLVCDGKPDCPGGEDEIHCANKRVTCSPNDFMCQRDGLCLPKAVVCDGQLQCSDGSDEKSCLEQPSTQHSDDDKKF